MPQKLTFEDVKQSLNNQILIASAKGKSLHRVVLSYCPLAHQYHVYDGADLDNVYSDFGTHLAIARYNELVGA